MNTHPCQIPPSKLPDPWLFDSEALLRELDRCRELTLQIPTNGDCNATHFAIQIAVNAQWSLRENLRYLLHLHKEQQRAIRRRHEESLSSALSQHNAKHNIVRLSQAETPAAEKRKHSRTPVSRSNTANRVA